MFKPKPGEVPKDNKFYRRLYPQIIQDIDVSYKLGCCLHEDIRILQLLNILKCPVLLSQRIENNWRTGRHTLQKIHCRSETSKGVYCLQYDDSKIVSGLRDNTIKVKLPQVHHLFIFRLCPKYDGFSSQ